MASNVILFNKTVVMKIFIAFTLLPLFSCYAQGQLDSIAPVLQQYRTSANDSLTSVLPGAVSYFYDNELDSLSYFQKQWNKKKCPSNVKGFKIQIYSCSGMNCQQKADKYYNQFLIAYPDITAHKLWDPPSYKVRVGNCRNRFEAEEIKAKIKDVFPFIFIVPDFIDSPYKIDCADME